MGLFPIQNLLCGVQDPHFKAVNHRRRIIQTSLQAEYAYCLAPGGMLYTITDVEELGSWMRVNTHCQSAFLHSSDPPVERNRDFCPDSSWVGATPNDFRNRRSDKYCLVGLPDFFPLRVRTIGLPSSPRKFVMG